MGPLRTVLPMLSVQTMQNVRNNRRAYGTFLQRLSMNGQPRSEICACGHVNRDSGNCNMNSGWHGLEQVKILAWEESWALGSGFPYTPVRYTHRQRPPACLSYDSTAATYQGLFLP